MSGRERERPETPSVLRFRLGNKSKCPKKPSPQMTHAEMVPRPLKATGKCAEVGSTYVYPSRQVWDSPCTSNVRLGLLHLGPKCKLRNHTSKHKSPSAGYYHDANEHTHQREQPKTTSFRANSSRGILNFLEPTTWFLNFQSEVSGNYGIIDKFLS